MQKAIMKNSVVFWVVYRNTTLRTWYYEWFIEIPRSEHGITLFTTKPFQSSESKKRQVSIVINTRRNVQILVLSAIHIYKIQSCTLLFLIFSLNSWSDIPTCLRNSLWKLLLSETPTIVCTDDVGASSSLSKRIASFRRTSWRHVRNGMRMQ